MPLIPLPDLPARLRETSGCSVGPTYSQVYKWALAGRLPAKREGCHMFVDSEAVPEIARLLGLERGEPAPIQKPLVYRATTAQKAAA